MKLAIQLALFLSLMYGVSCAQCDRDNQTKLLRTTAICSIEDIESMDLLIQVLTVAKEAGYTHVIDTECGQIETDAIPIDTVIADMVRIKEGMIDGTQDF